MNKILSKKSIMMVLGTATLLFASCTKYQYVTLNSELPKNNQFQFVMETDSLTIKYGFNGYNCPVIIEIDNMMDKPAYVDWSKSAVIIDGVRYSYWSDESRFSGNINTSGIIWNETYATSSGNFSGTMVRREKVSFIPPGSTLKVNPLQLQRSMIEPEEGQIENNARILDNKARQYTLKPEETPFAFRSYLTVSNDENFGNPSVFDHQFYTSEIINTALAPKTFPNRLQNQYYIKESTRFGNTIFWTTIGILTVIGLVAAVE